MKLRIKNWEKTFENSESRKLKSLKWVAMPNRMNTQGYTALIDHPNGAAHFGAWCAIVEICSAREPRELRGTLPESDGTIGGISRALGRISRLPSEIFEELLPRLIHDQEIAWIEQYADASGKSPDASGENPETSGRNRREGEGREGEGTGRQAPERPAKNPKRDRVNKAWDWFKAEYPGDVNDFVDCQLFLSVVETDADIDALQDNLPLWKQTRKWADGFFPSSKNFLSERIFKITPKPDVKDNRRGLMPVERRRYTREEEIEILRQGIADPEETPEAIRSYQQKLAEYGVSA